MYGYIVVTADDELTVCKSDQELNNADLWKSVGGYYEIVNPILLHNTVWENVRILCDEEGLYKDLKANKLASALYAGPTPIVGNVVLCTTEAPYPSEPDIWPFDEVSLPPAVDFFTRLLERLKNVKID